MALKLEKLKTDLNLDLSEYIPGEAGKIDAVKKTPEDFFNWIKYCGTIAEEDRKVNEDKSLSEAEKLDKTREHLIKQVDYLYGKGDGYWKAVPFTLLTRIIMYLNKEVNEVEKK